MARLGKQFYMGFLVGAIIVSIPLGWKINEQRQLIAGIESFTKQIVDKSTQVMRDDIKKDDSDNANAQTVKGCNFQPVPAISVVGMTITAKKNGQYHWISKADPACIKIMSALNQ